MRSSPRRDKADHVTSVAIQCELLERVADVAADLVETRTFGSCVIYERYTQTRDEPD